jgi:signal transduction histidine kinase
MLGYALGMALQLVFTQLVVHRPVPFPWWSDIIALLAFPGFFLAPALWPGVAGHRQTGLARTKLLLDVLLVMGAVTVLSWFFFLAPLFARSSASWQAKVVELAYPVADLAGCFALAVVLLRPNRDVRHRTILRLLLVTAGCLILADSWTLWIRLYAPSQPAALPILVFILAALLLPLAGLVQYRLAWRMPWAAEGRVAKKERSLNEQDLVECARLLLPFAAALLAGVAVEVRMLFAPIPAAGEVVPHLLILLLLLVALVRQAVGFLEYVRVRREREAERANAHSLLESTRQMETFLGIASHELKTPLTSLQGNIQLIARRLNRVELEQAQAEDLVPLVRMASTLIERSERSLGRLGRLIDDLLDDSRIRQGHLEHRLEVCDLAVVVQEAVEEQRLLAPNRTILLGLPEAPVAILADPGRIGQVVTNYLTNAHKYSPEDRPVEVGVQTESQHGRAWVRDQGPGIFEHEQGHLWERFHRVPGMNVQCGSGVGLGLGLHISKSIIEWHHGTVGVDSVPGEGSTFWFTLPLAETQEA